MKQGELDPADINEKVVADHLYTRNWPDPDVLIRTSGEMRVSNFLLWQISYAELVVTPTFWPDFRKPQFYAALEEYNRRHRTVWGTLGNLRFTIYEVKPGSDVAGVVVAVRSAMNGCCYYGVKAR